MGSLEPSGVDDSREWELLASLFAQPGAYRHRMGLRRFPTTEFYAPTADGEAIRAEKKAILDRAGENRLVTTPEGHEAAIEFARLLELPVDAPPEADDVGRSGFNRRLGLAVEPDLLFVRPPDWSLVWANVCFPTRWSLEGKARRPLAWIHDAVPDLNAKLSARIGTFFARLVPGEGWRRANWGLSTSTIRNQHPEEAIPSLEAITRPEQIVVRVEDQQFVKLPLTGLIVFGIRIVSFAWSDVMARPAIANALLEKLQSMQSEIAVYKGLDRFLPALSEKS